MSDQPLTTENCLRKALTVAIGALDYAAEHGAPDLYDGPIPKGWEDTLDDASGWPVLRLIIAKCAAVLNER